GFFHIEAGTRAYSGGQRGPTSRRILREGAQHEGTAGLIFGWNTPPHRHRIAGAGVGLSLSDFSLPPGGSGGDGTLSAGPAGAVGAAVGDGHWADGGGVQSLVGVPGLGAGG